MYQVLHYTTADGVDTFEQWLDCLADPKAAARIVARIGRLNVGNFGDFKSVGNGVLELRIDYGPGYRVYYSVVGRKVILLLCGGDKRRQSADIQKAHRYLLDYHSREPSS